MPEEQLFNLRWNEHLHRSSEGAPLLPSVFVISQGPRVNLVDLRSLDEATGVVGYIPGSVCIDPERLQELPKDSPVVLVSRTGVQAAREALRLEQQGMTRVAALEGGVVAWRALGFCITRDPTALASSLMIQPEFAKRGSVLTLDRIREHIGDPRSIRWVKMVALVNQGILSCIDGRDKRSVVGTLGGDAGELLLVLAGLEHADGVELDEAAVTKYLVDRIDSFGNFYMHTDEDALERLIDSLRSDPRTKGTVREIQTLERWGEFLDCAPVGIRDALLEHLANPAHIGCGHIRLMLERPEDYGIRRDLVASVIRAFYTLCWQGAPGLHLTVLPGGHEEAAILNVRIEGELWALTHVPLVSPSCGGQQMFVNHPDVAQHLRNASVRLMGNGRTESLRAAVDELAGRQLSATLGHLAKGLPVIDAVFKQDGTVDVNLVSRSVT